MFDGLSVDGIVKNVSFATILEFFENYIQVFMNVFHVILRENMKK